MHEKPFKCTDCRVRFSSEELLNDHKNLGVCKQSRTCFVCNQVFESPRDLKHHLIEFHRNNETSPSEAVARELEIHMAKIEEEKRIEEVRTDTFDHVVDFL